jgi:hypothetical protein
VRGIKRRHAAAAADYLAVLGRVKVLALLAPSGARGDLDPASARQFARNCGGP